MPLTRRQIYRRRRIVVFGGLFAVLGGIAYLPLTLLAPVTETAPRVEAPRIETPAAAEPFWPDYGAAAIGAIGFDGILGQSGRTDAVPMASITKVVTALTVLDAHPLAVGEEGPTVTMTQADVGFYRDSLARGGSVAPVRAGMTLTQLELLELTLIDSANNYSASLAQWGFGSQEAFVAAARAWLDAHELPGVTVVEASGLDRANTATATDLVHLGELALAQPVVAGIVGTASAEIPGIGAIANTNKLIGTDGVDGIKTGTLDDFGANLLFSAELPVGGETVRLVGVVLGGPDHPTINGHILSMIQQAAAGFHEVPLVEAGQEIARYTTPWETTVSAVAARGASVVVWGDTPVEVAARVDPIRLAEAGSEVGELVFTVAGREIAVPIELDGDVEDPGPWWRLGHPELIVGMG